MKRLFASVMALVLAAEPLLVQAAAAQPAPPPAAPIDQIASKTKAPQPGAAPTPAPISSFGAVITKASGQALEGVAVMVNGEVISFSDVRNRMGLILMGLGAKPDEELIQQAQQRAIDALINEKIQAQEYKKLVKDRPIEDADIDERLEAMARQNNMTSEAFMRDLANRGINVSTLREKIRAETGWQRIIGGRFGRNIRISQLQIDDRLDQIKQSADKPQYRLMEIFLYAPDAASKEKAKGLALNLKKQIEGGVPFDQAAQQFSYAPSASAGGDLDWISQGDVKPEIAKAVLAGKAPSLLDPIEADDGVYLMAYLGKREAASADDAKMNLKQIVSKDADANDKLNEVKAKVKSCADVEKAAGSVQGVKATNLNEVALSGMPEAYKAALSPLQPGQATDILNGNAGKMVLFVCERAAGAALPSRKQIEDGLFDIQVGMMADRYLRNLKREATIDRPRRS